MASNYHVCQRAKNGTGKGLRTLGKPISKLEAAREFLEEVRLNNKEPLAIYRFTWGKIPEFIEGDTLP